MDAKQRDVKQRIAQQCSACDQLATKKCDKCQGPYYCSRECQIKAWPDHKGWCMSHRNPQAEQSVKIVSRMNRAYIKSDCTKRVIAALNQAGVFLTYDCLTPTASQAKAPSVDELAKHMDLLSLSIDRGWKRDEKGKNAEGVTRLRIGSYSARLSTSLMALTVEPAFQDLDVLCSFRHGEYFQEKTLLYRSASGKLERIPIQETTAQGKSDDAPRALPQCAYCKSENANHHCGRCSRVFYCSKECQKSDWKVHKTSCTQSKVKTEACVANSDRLKQAEEVSKNVMKHIIACEPFTCVTMACQAMKMVFTMDCRKVSLESSRNAEDVKRALCDLCKIFSTGASAVAKRDGACSEGVAPNGVGIRHFGKFVSVLYHHLGLELSLEPAPHHLKGKFGVVRHQDVQLWLDSIDHDAI